MHYVKTGDPGKPPVVFLHGFMGSGRDWSSVINLLDKQFSAITIDLPGHGATGAMAEDSDYTLSATAAQVIAVLDELGIGKCPLVGYSLGGRLALVLALNYPDRFSHLALESASPGIKDAEERSERRAADELLEVGLEQDCDMETFVLRWYYQPMFHGLAAHPEFQRLLQSRMGNDPLLLAKSLRGMGQAAMEPLWNDLGKIAIPTLLMTGENDRKYRELFKEMRQSNPAFHIEIIQECSHNAHFMNSKKFAKVLGTFISAEENR